MFLSRVTLKFDEWRKFPLLDICEGTLPVTGEFPAQRASNAENASIWWRHHDGKEIHSNPYHFQVVLRLYLLWLPMNY